MKKLHDTLSRPGRPEGPRRPGGPSRSGGRRAAVGAAVLLALLGPVLGSTTAHAAPASPAPGGPAPASPAPGGPAPSSPPPSGPAPGSPAPGGPPPSRDRLLSGETLKPGQSISAGHDALTMQGNGNLVLAAPGHTPLWSTRTGGNQGAQLVMQPNGNLAVVAPGGQALWSAGTARHSGAILILQPNGNAVIQTPASAPTSSVLPSSSPLGSAPTSSGPPLWSTDTFRQTYADIQLAAHGWTQGQARQFACLDSIWTRESKWDEQAGNPASAYGIPQASPGAKMAAAGPDWLTSPQTQIRWGEDYIEAQYGTPCQAWAHWQVHKNY